MGAVVMALVTDRVERRLLIFASTLVWLAGMLAVGSRRRLEQVSA